MHRRTWVGLAALAALTVGLNAAVLTQAFFSAPVLLLLAAAFLLGLAWAGLGLFALTRASGGDRRSLYGLSTVIASLLFLGICIVLYAFAAHWDRSWDLTAEGRRDLAEQTVRVLESMNQDVEVIAFFMQVEDRLIRIAKNKTERFLEQCQTYTPRLDVTFLDPQIERARLEALNISHASTQGTVVVSCGTRKRVITLTGASPRLEERAFTNALINVLRDAQPKVCFLTGHGERDIADTNEQEGASIFKVLLEAEAYAVEPIAMPLTHPEVPEDCDILVINGLGTQGPRGDLHPQELRAIQEYLARGGRLLVLLDPWIRTTGNAQAEQLRPWLEEHYGIAVGNNVLISPETQWSVELRPDPGLFDDTEPVAAFRGSFNYEHPITKLFEQQMVLRVARTVAPAETLPDGVICTSLLRSTPEFWAETDVALLFETGKAYKQPGETLGPKSVAAAAVIKTDTLPAGSGAPRDARIVVVGDTDFAANGQLAVVPGHLNFILNTIAWLSESEELIAIRPTGKEELPLLLSEGEKRAVVWVSVLGTLQLTVAAGLIAYLLRRKHQ